MKRLVSLMIVCGVSMLLSAQSITLSGKVVDLEKGLPLSNVIVMLKTEDGKAILRHTTTDEKGTFSLEISMMEKRMLTFSLMGYESVNLPLQTGKKEYRVSLKPKTIQMKEVTVKAPKIRTKGDTIVYNVSRFADAQDKTIADVLKKMPGIDVETNGRISYNGKAINKFYIEGLDMLEGRYGIATNSISQQDVSAIEVMENHQPVRALEEIELSEQAALNVKLKKDARARWLAVLRGGAGFSPALWKGDLSLMRFKGNGQQMYTYKGNNTGNDVTGQHRLLTVEEMLSRMSGEYSLPSYLDMQTSGAPNLDEDRTLFNQSHTFAGNQLFKLGKDYQLTTRMLYANDRRTSDYLSHTEHFLADSLIVTELKDETRIHTDALTAEATLQANTKNNAHRIMRPAILHFMLISPFLLCRQEFFHHKAVDAHIFNFVPTFFQTEYFHLRSGFPFGHFGAFAGGGIAYVDGGAAGGFSIIGKQAHALRFGIEPLQAAGLHIAHVTVIADFTPLAAVFQHHHHCACLAFLHGFATVRCLGTQGAFASLGGVDHRHLLFFLCRAAKVQLGSADFLFFTVQHYCAVGLPQTNKLHRFVAMTDNHRIFLSSKCSLII